MKLFFLERICHQLLCSPSLNSGKNIEVLQHLEFHEQDIVTVTLEPQPTLMSWFPFTRFKFWMLSRSIFYGGKNVNRIPQSVLPIKKYSLSTAQLAIQLFSLLDKKGKTITELILANFPWVRTECMSPKTSNILMGFLMI